MKVSINYFHCSRFLSFLFCVADEGLRICSRSLTAKQASCCSQDSEMKYLLASEKYIVDSIRHKNSNLKQRITEHMDDYQGRKDFKLLKNVFIRSLIKKFADYETNYLPLILKIFPRK